MVSRLPLDGPAWTYPWMGARRRAPQMVAAGAASLAKSPWRRVVPTARAGSVFLNVAGRRPDFRRLAPPISALVGPGHKCTRIQPTFTGSLGSPRACLLCTQRRDFGAAIVASHKNMIPVSLGNVRRRLAVRRLVLVRLRPLGTHHQTPEERKCAQPAAATARAAASRRRRPAAPAEPSFSRKGRLDGPSLRAAAARRPCTRRFPPRPDPSFRR